MYRLIPRINQADFDFSKIDHLVVAIHHNPPQRWIPQNVYIKSPSLHVEGCLDWWKYTKLIWWCHKLIPYGSKYLLRICLGYNLPWLRGLSTLLVRHCLDPQGFFDLLRSKPVQKLPHIVQLRHESHCTAQASPEIPSSQHNFGIWWNASYMMEFWCIKTWFFFRIQLQIHQDLPR